MAVMQKKAATNRTRQLRGAKSKTLAKNGDRTAKAVKKAGVYLMRPRRTPQAIRRAKRLAALVRQELAAREHGTLEEVMQTLRGQ